MIPVNRKVGKFEIVRKLARGGMADVYLGRDEDTGVTVADVKLEGGQLQIRDKSGRVITLKASRPL